MKIESAVMTLFNVTAMVDGNVSDDEKKMIFDVMKNQFFCSEKELETGFEKNLKQLEENTMGMIQKAVLTMREECSAKQMKNVIKLLKDLATIDKNLDRREMMIIELLEQLTEEE
ncbi:TerB family tellurite resistance protein [candidate division KSB1 bacterium]|nr:TerB family tellurite resistance protein [candidate division KSB1 bacterium]